MRTAVLLILAASVFVGGTACAERLDSVLEGNIWGFQYHPPQPPQAAPADDQPPVDPGSAGFNAGAAGFNAGAAGFPRREPPGPVPRYEIHVPAGEAGPPGP